MTIFQEAPAAVSAKHPVVAKPVNELYGHVGFAS